jgi:hypothetical protein
MDVYALTFVDIWLVFHKKAICYQDSINGMNAFFVYFLFALTLYFKNIPHKIISVTFDWTLYFFSSPNYVNKVYVSDIFDGKKYFFLQNSEFLKVSPCTSNFMWYCFWRSVQNVIWHKNLKTFPAKVINNKL